MAKAVDASAPAFANDLPGWQPWRVVIGRTPGVVVVQWEETGPSHISVTEAMPDEETLRILAAAEGVRIFAGVRRIDELASWFGPRRLLLILDVVDGRVDGQLWADQVIDWLNDEPVRKAEADNMSRVRALIPQPTGWDIGAIADACWVVESERGCSQGTAFALKGKGFVTCHHVVHGVGRQFASAPSPPTSGVSIS